MAGYTTHSALETARLGERLGKKLHGGAVVAFTGGLGAGKTTFCTGIARALGSTDPVSSPTFTVANIYRGPVTFAHFDAYRIEGEQDLEMAGFYDYIEAGAVVAVEWSERLAGLLEDDVIRVRIEPGPGDVRHITIEGVELD